MTVGRVLRTAALGLALFIAPAGAGPMAAADVPAEVAVTEALEGGQPTVGVGHSTVIAGRSLAFTGVGFHSGEQVVASFGGVAAASTTLTVGKFGEVAGTIAVPADTRSGNHVPRVMSAVSDFRAQVAVVIVPPDVVAPAACTPGVDLRWDEIAVWAIIGGLVLVVVWAVILAITRRRSARKARADS